MANTSVGYTFHEVRNCNMCGAPASHHRVVGKRLNQSQGLFPKMKVGISTTVMKCKKCDLIFSNPQPIPLDIQQHYGVPPESYWTNDYFTIQPDYFQKEINQLRKVLTIQEGMKSLDIGAGLGKAMIALQAVGFDAYGFEPSQPFYERAISKMGISTEKLLLGKIEDMVYPENTFDFISFGAVLEHLYEPSESIVKAMKWLKPGGIIHIEVPSSHWLIGFFLDMYYQLTFSGYTTHISPMHAPYHLYEFGLKSFQQHASNHSYEIAHHEYEVCYTYLPKWTNFFIHPFMQYTNTGMQLILWLKKK
jgi:ubiquinone/menaquinone biosynthesis C-methylase UbiE